MSLLSRTARRTLTVVFCGAALSVAPVFAQTDAPPPQGPPPPYAGPRHGGAGHRVEMLQHELNLSADQTAQVKALFETERSKMEALRSNSTLSNEDRRSQMMTIHQDEETKLRALLTPDQVTKYDAMQAHMRARMQQREDGGGPPPPPPSGNPQ